MKYIFRICEECEKQFELKDTKLNRNRRFCSGYCARSNSGKKNKGKRFSDEINRKKGKSGELNNFYGKRHTEQQKEKWRKRILNKTYDELYGEEKANEIRDKLRRNSLGENNSFYGKHHSDETKELMSYTRTKNLSEGNTIIKSTWWGYKGWYVSLKNDEKYYYDSFWELIRMKILDLDVTVIKWTKRHGIKIPYFKEYKHYYVPDFLITYENSNQVLEEVKGYDESKKEKILALKKYCKKNSIGYNIIQQDELNELCIKFFNKAVWKLKKEFKNDKENFGSRM